MKNNTVTNKILDKAINLPKFWKIYIFVITIFVILTCIFFLILSVLLRRYENTSAIERAEQAREAEISRAAESESIALAEFEEKNSVELKSSELLSKRSDMLLLLDEAEKTALLHVSVSLDSNPDKVMDALMTELSKKGCSCLSGFMKSNIGRYEDMSNVYKFVDSAEGEYSYEKNSELSYTIKKGGLSLKAELKEGAANEKGHKTYSLSSVSVTVPVSGYTIEAPSSAALKINGKAVTDAPTVKKPTVPSSIPASFNIPSVATYNFEGFVYRPETSATLDGTSCSRTDYEDKMVFKSPVTAKYNTELSGRIRTLAFAYSDFVAGEFGFGTLRQYLYARTELYEGLENFDNRWYHGYTKLENKNAKITDLTVISDRLVYAHIEYDQLLYNGARVYKTVQIVLDLYIGCSSAEKAADPDAWQLVFVESF